MLTQHKPDEFVDYNADLEIVDGLSTITVDQLLIRLKLLLQGGENTSIAIVT